MNRANTSHPDLASPKTAINSASAASPQSATSAPVGSTPHHSGQRFPWISELVEIDGDAAQAALLHAHAEDFSPALVDSLYEAVVTLARVDLRHVERLALAATAVAAAIPPGPAAGVAHRARGHACFLVGDHVAAIDHHRLAVAVFLAHNDPIQAARARMNQIQPLTYLGRYEEAYSAAYLARETFLAAGDRLRVARLSVNLANVLYRQDRFQDALAMYSSARDELASSGDPQDLAVLLRNMAVCHTSLNNFDLAAKAYQEARDICEARGFPLMMAEADYNVAYLHYLRGEYTRAIALYQTARQLCSRLKNHYHTALCDLDLSELYLELNMSQEGALLAQSAIRGFEALDMRYERAKAVAFSAIASSQMGQNQEALRRFTEARALFIQENNPIWPGLIDFYRALAHFEEKRYRLALPLVRASLRLFKKARLLTKAALAQILLARLHLEFGRLHSAIACCQGALQLLENTTSPAIEFHAVAVISLAEERLGNIDQAYASLKRANTILEDLRSHILGEAFRIGFLKDKLSIYPRLAELALALEPPETRNDAVFSYMERAKSRSLADLVSLGSHALRARGLTAPDRSLRIEDLRLRMTMAYRQAQREEFRAEKDSIGRIRNYREESLAYERELALATGLHNDPERDPDRGPDHELSRLLSAGTLPLSEVLGTLAKAVRNTAIVEYFEFSGHLQAAVLTRSSMRIVSLCPIAEIRSILGLLQFQLSKFLLGPDHTNRFRTAIQLATDEHLRSLYDQLIEPLHLPLWPSPESSHDPAWTGQPCPIEHLVIVPHACLHSLPFHILLSQPPQTPSRSFALIDRVTISYAPSASVYVWCLRNSSTPGGPFVTRSLVLGVPDIAAPSIREESQAVAALLPHSTLFVGHTATREILWKLGPESRFIHLATHGLFRRDNPMFSSIRLGDADLHPADFYSLRLSARLVTLSGCGTGLNAIVGGDEILGLVRGLLYAGAQAVLVSLWDVSDQVTTLFMKTFYTDLQHSNSLATALRRTMRTLRASHPHPYYWAAFVLIGDAETPLGHEPQHPIAGINAHAVPLPEVSE